MTDERNKAERELEDLVRELPPESAAPVDFVQNLRACFSSGAIEPGLQAGGPAVAGDTDVAGDAGDARDAGIAGGDTGDTGDTGDAADTRDAGVAGGLSGDRGDTAASDLEDVALLDLTGVWSEEIDEVGPTGSSSDATADKMPRVVLPAVPSSSSEGSGRVVAFPVWAQALAIAAAVALVFSALEVNRGVGPEQIEAQGSGTLRIDGQSFALSELETFRPLLAPGASIHLEGDMSTLLDLIYPGFMAVQVTAGVEMTIPEPAGRWFNRTARFEVEHGEVRVVTGPDFAGADLSILAPGTEIDITGTTFAVISSPCSTCVCVLEGIAQMKDEEGTVREVRAGRRQTFFNDNDDPPLEEPIREEERMKLEMLREAALRRLVPEKKR